MEMKGLTEFQEDLLEIARKDLLKESKAVLRKVGNKALKEVRERASDEVEIWSGNYHKGWKRGKAFKGKDGEAVIRVINSAPHAHLIEHGHRIVRGGKTVGFAPGKKILEKGIKDFDGTGQYEKMISEWLDKMLESGKL